MMMNQAPSHYMNQYWQNSLTPNAFSRVQWINIYAGKGLVLNQALIWTNAGQISSHPMISLKVKQPTDPDSKIHGANMGPTWVLSAPDGPHVGPMNLAIRGANGAFQMTRKVSSRGFILLLVKSSTQWFHHTEAQQYGLWETVVIISKA